MRIWTSHGATRTGGALLLSGGVGLVGLVLIHVSASGAPVDLGMATGLERSASFDAPHDRDGGQSSALVSAVPLIPFEARGSVPSTATTGIDEEPPASARPVSASSAWFEAFQELDAAALGAEAQRTLVPGGDSARQVGLLHALALASPLEAAPFVTASRLPERPGRGISVASYALDQLSRRAAEPSARGALGGLAFDPLVSSRLRGRAVAALVSHASPLELRQLCERLLVEPDDSLVACALGAAAQRGPLAQNALAELDLDLAARAGLVAGTCFQPN